MLSIVGGEGHSKFCDGVPRRDFLKIGALGVGGLSMPDILRAEAQAGIRNSRKSIIMIFLAGGPPHQDMVDLKPDAPLEVRGEFSPIDTNVPGIQICEHLPLTARMMDKFALIRSVVGCAGNHTAYQFWSGRDVAGQPRGGWPSVGSVLSKLQGSGDGSPPPYVSLVEKCGSIDWRNPGQSGFLGSEYIPFRPTKGGANDVELGALTLDRLQGRRRLLSDFDRMRSRLEASNAVEGMDSFQQQAFQVLTSNRLASALDVESEAPGVRERYGRGTREHILDGPPLYNEYFLMARKLVEVGVRCVTVSFGRWDTHSSATQPSNFASLRRFLPALDLGLTALVQDLHDRGLDEDVSVLVGGEFGRTPKINVHGGRDHWPPVSFMLLAGGGMRTGQLIGATDRQAGEATDRPVHFQEIYATLYKNLGIDAANITLPDFSGRPQYLLESQYRPLPELG